MRCCAQGLSAEESALSAGECRLRLIIMTPFANVVGGIPLMLGAGPQLLQPLPIALVGGTLASVVLPADLSLPERAFVGSGTGLTCLDDAQLGSAPSAGGRESDLPATTNNF